MKNALLIIFLIFCSACKKSADSQLKNRIDTLFAGTKENESLRININKNTVKERFSPPQGYTWIEEKPRSFGYFLENFQLKKYGSPILKYDGTEIETQNLHEAIFDIDTGEKDLQQCADAVIRLRAEYLFKNKKFEDIKFHFTSGDLMTWNDYKNGTRAVVNGNSVQFRKMATYDDSYQTFRKYLDLIFNYAGTISLNKETKEILKNEDLKTGDFIITPGSPGHIVFITGIAENGKGQKLYLLAEGYTPAQSIHVLNNPFDPKISPWYELEVNSRFTRTARYLFESGTFRSF